MKKILFLAHILLSLVLGALVIFTSFLSPLSEVGPMSKEITEKVNIGYAYGNTWIRLYGIEDEGIVLSYSTDMAPSGFDVMESIHITKEGTISKSSSISSKSDPKFLVYHDRDGNFIPEKKGTKSDGIRNYYNFDSIEWNLTKTIDDNQAGMETP